MNNPDSSNSRITRSQHAVKENQDAVGGEDIPAPVVPPNSKKRKATKQNKKKTTPDDEPAGNISKKPRKGDETTDRNSRRFYLLRVWAIACMAGTSPLRDVGKA